MRQCKNCKELIKDELEVCPFCGYIEIRKQKTSGLHGIDIRRIPIWVKIIVPIVLVLLVVSVAYLINDKFKIENEVIENDSLSESAFESNTGMEPEETVLEVDVVVLNIGEHSYACYFGCTSWEQARDYCESVGGHLAVITSPRENEALYAFSRYCGFDNVYIGYSDIDSEGHWRWVTGEQSDYTNWNDGEPNGFTAIENYAVMVDNGYWNDGDYTPRIENGIVAYICEWDYEVTGVNNFNYDEIIELAPEAPEPSVADVNEVVGVVPDGDYCAVSYIFAGDGLSGEIHLYTYDMFSPNYVENLNIGDMLPDGSVIEFIDGRRINGWSFRLQENGWYYWFDEGEVAVMSEYGEYTLPISSDVVISDCANPFSSDGIMFDEDSYVFDSIQDFEALLNDENTWGRPDLFIRVDGGQITYIISNPWNHQPWRYIPPAPTLTPTPIPTPVDIYEAALTEEQAVQAFGNYYNSIFGDLEVPEGVPCYWLQGETDGSIINFRIRSYTGAITDYYMDLNTGITNYEDYEPSVPVAMSGYAFSAWDYI